MKKLHHNQEKLLSLLKQYIDDPLTMEQLKGELKAASKSVVFHHIKQLEQKGYLKRNPSNPQDYQILTEPEKPITYINLYGMAKCGPKGSFLDGNPIKRVPIASCMLSFPAADAFMVEAKGCSMEPYIHEKDWVIAQKNNIPTNKSVVVCINNGEVLIKRMIKEKKALILESFNNSYPPFTASMDDFKIVGVVKSVVRRSIS